jgi:caffeoyl-CoA O-methyltransferase
MIMPLNKVPDAFGVSHAMGQLSNQEGALMKSLVSAEIEAYATAHSMDESEVCRDLRAETHQQMDCPQMLVGPLEGAFLKLLTQIVGASRVLEIGMFTGYSALCFAEALPEGGTVTTCEIDDTSAALARRYFARSPHGHKITVRMGPAIETMQALDGRYDLIFIDADKQNYLNYYRRAKELLTPKGVMVIDNVLWDGDVLLQPAPDERTAAIQELNRFVASDPAVSAVLLTIRDGVLLVRRKA